MAKRISMAGDTADRNEINSAKPSGEVRAVIELFFCVDVPPGKCSRRVGRLRSIALPVPMAVQTLHCW